MNSATEVECEQCGHGVQNAAARAGYVKDPLRNTEMRKADQKRRNHECQQS